MSASGTLPRNLLATFASQFYVTILAIVMMPFYLRFLGAEAFGLVGFFTLLQAWFNLLDFGLTATIARESARLKGGATDALSYRRLVRALTLIFVFLALLGGGLMFGAAGWIATGWLNAQHLPYEEIRLAVELMAAGVAMRWMSGLYRGVVSGSEQLAWLGAFTAIIATLRFAGVLVAMAAFGATPKVFFIYQLAVAAIELGGNFLKARQLFPALRQDETMGWSIAPIKPVLKFSLGIAFASSVGVLSTQFDKLILSKVLPLTDYGYFTLAVLVASGVLMLSAPVSAVLLPRMARLEAEGKHGEMVTLYRRSTQMVALVAGAGAALLALQSEPLLRFWTGDPVLATKVAKVLGLYAVGNCLFAISAFPYYLQYAKGTLKLHLIGNAAFLALLIPSAVWAAITYGSIGAAYAWLVLNTLLAAFWVPFVHSKIEPGLSISWMFRDLAAILGPIALAAFMLEWLWSSDIDLVTFGLQFAASGVILLLAGAAGSSFIREQCARLMSFRQ